MDTHTQICSHLNVPRGRYMCVCGVECEHIICKLSPLLLLSITGFDPGFCMHVGSDPSNGFLPSEILEKIL